MQKQLFRTMQIVCDDPEWLYVPNVEYADLPSGKLFLQLIIPYQPGLTERYPLLLFIPGAAWHSPEVYNSIPAYAKLAERGFVIAVLQHRGSETARFPAPVQDAKAALRFLVTKAEGFHIDVDRIYLMGNSSGGHIALMTALTQAHGLYDSDLYPGVPFDLKGVIACSAPSDLIRCAEEPLPEFMRGQPRPTELLLGVQNVPAHPELAQQASCGRYITESAAIPPIFLIHGVNDGQVSVEQSRDLFALLRQHNKAVWYLELEAEGHGGSAFWSPEVLDRVEQFLRTFPGGAPEA